MRLLRVAVLGVLVAALGGCFMVPLLDGRSPFDSYKNPSNRQIAAGLPILEGLLDEIATPEWDLAAQRKAGHCEGDCNLRFAIRIYPEVERVVTSIDSHQFQTVPASALGVSEEPYEPFTVHRDIDEDFIATIIDTAKDFASDTGIPVDIEHRLKRFSHEGYVYAIDGEYYEALKIEPHVEGALRNLYGLDDDADLSEIGDERLSVGRDFPTQRVLIVVHPE